MPSLLQSFPICFKKLHLASNKTKAINEVLPATAEYITVAQFAEATSPHEYQNKPCTGWRNWLTVGNTVYAQHPTEAWYVKVDNLRLFAYMVDEQTTLEQLSLVLYTYSSHSLVLAPFQSKAVMPELGPDLKYTRLVLKGQKEPTTVRFINEVDVSTQRISIVELNRRTYQVYALTWLEVLDRYTMAPSKNPLVLQEVASARCPDYVQILKKSADVYYSSQDNQLRMDAFHEPLRALEPYVFAQLEQVGVSLLPGGPNVTVTWDDFSLKVTVSQFFQLAEQGWFFAQWLTPQPHIECYNPFFVENRQASYVFNNEKWTGILNFAYRVQNGNHFLSIEDENNSLLAVQFEVETLSELSSKVRDWMRSNLESIQLNIRVSVILNQDEQVVKSLVFM